MRVHRLAPQRDESFSSRTASEDLEWELQSCISSQPSFEPAYVQRLLRRDVLQEARLSLADLTPAPPTQLS